MQLKKKHQKTFLVLQDKSLGMQKFTDIAWPGLTFSEGFYPAKVRLNSSAETQINRQRAEMCEYLRNNI